MPVKVWPVGIIEEESAIMVMDRGRNIRANLTWALGADSDAPGTGVRPAPFVPPWDGNGAELLGFRSFEKFFTQNPPSTVPTPDPNLVIFVTNSVSVFPAPG
jgi:hypothetical protein